MEQQSGHEQAKRLPVTRLLFEPNLSINGLISEDTLTHVLDRLSHVRSAEMDLVVEINTQGGDADVARRIALEVRLFRRHSERSAYCIGKTNVYSAGMTVLAAFAPENRCLTDDAVLLIHERRLDESIKLTGPIRSCLQIVREQLQLLKTAKMLEMEGFRELVEGSALSLDDLYERAKTNCYLTAQEAFEAGLIRGVLR